MELSLIVDLLVLGAILGATGQVIRTVVGIKKLNDSAIAEGKSLAQLFHPSDLVVSLIIGATAGVLAAIIMSDKLQAWNAGESGTGGELLWAILASGYAGADFIEGFMKKSSGAVPLAANTDSKSNVGSSGREPDDDQYPPFG